MLIGTALRDTAEQLTPVLADFALPYSERILQYLTGCSRNELYLSTERQLGSDRAQQLVRIVKRCETGEPLDYILGTTYFFNREFIVTPDVLLPRPDTELLVEVVLKHQTKSSAIFAEIGIGSGIISCILTERMPEWQAVGVDISKRALDVAKRNRQSNRVQLVCSDCLYGLAKENRYDFIISNPPYIASVEMINLDTSVTAFEPTVALNGGVDGLAFYRRFAEEVSDYLKPGGVLYCEIGYDQKESVQKLFERPEWCDFHCFHDLAGHPRVIRIRLRK